ncbi:hypothetical protein ZIOFF_037176 [Zingiber officinale]|uniref:Uncharacterized protein n=1 Tax=Zingiber officinale TaxID=94328 RepID=A0A8J5GBA9_ZINOF|nr:hypothetical protein ZIOFF_037176 [Zingiber officinale]
MAEARREIVTALKLHRATMKHATELQKFQQQQQQHQNPSPSPTLELSPAVLGEIQKELNENRINFTTHPFNYTFSNHLQNTNLLPSEYHSFPWMHLPITPITVHENLNITCHNNPLGFHPNLQSFNNRNNTFGDKLYWKSTMQPSSQPTSSTSSSLESIMPSFQASYLSKGSCRASCDALDPASRAFHPWMDADEIAQIHLIGEQHDMEWNDKMNMMASGWWSKFLRNMDDGFCEGAGGEKIGSHMSDGFGEGARGEKIGSHMSNEEFNMLSCLSNGNAREPCFLEQCMWNYVYYNEEDYLPDAAFPW